ncbi:MAG TPA: sulfoacetaldehyde acetyltransferase [Candidatus Binataceae bacterium]|nr:sulfoacetaldehyde acetyltransferase [Candidatus Binataceae bacterium]
MKQMITGSEALVEALRLESVDTIFGIVGSAFMDPLDIFPRANLRFIQVRHEQNAALMAEGYSRASGRPGLCIGQNGPGVTNLVTGVASALLNHTPMVVITPAVATVATGTRAFQEIDQMRLFEPIVVWQTQVNRADRMSEAVRGAFRAAIAMRGPAQIDIPRDVYYGKTEEGLLMPAQYRVEGRFGGAPQAEIQRAARLLLEAKTPVFLAGLGAVDDEAARTIGELADRFTAPVACVWLHNDAFPASHPLAVGPIGYQSSAAAMRLLSEADCVLALGTRLNSFGTTPQYDFDFFPRKAKLIHNSINPLEIGALRPVEVGLVGDCAAVASQLLAATAGKKPNVDRQARLAHIAEEKKDWHEKLTAMSCIDGSPIHPRRALLEIARAVPEDVCVVSDVGNVSGTANAYFSFDKARRWFGHGSLGGIGVGFSTALGVKVARPEAPVLALVGDGAWSMTLQEVMTAVTEKINLVTVIFNNGQYGAEKRNQYDFFNKRFFWTDLQNPNFAAIASEMGALGVRIDRPEDVAPNLREAFAADRPVVLDLKIDKVLAEPYRRDAMRIPERVLPRYRD